MKTINIQKVSGQFVVKVPLSGDYIINDTKHRLESNREYIFPNEITSMIYLEHNKVQIKWINIEKDSSISLDEYNKQYNKVIECADYGDEYGYHFSNLEDEYKYKKFLRFWTREYENQISEIPFDIQIVNLIKSDYTEIVPMWSLGEINNPLCKYSPNAVRLFKKIAEDLGFTIVHTDNPNAMELSISTHSGLDYAKTDGKYIYGSGKGPKLRVLVGTYDECVNLHKKNIERLTKDLKLYVNRHLLDKESINAKDFLDELLSIKGSVSRLNIKMSDRMSHNITINKIAELINKLQKTVSK